MPNSRREYCKAPAQHEPKCQAQHNASQESKHLRGGGVTGREICSRLKTQFVTIGVACYTSSMHRHYHSVYTPIYAQAVSVIDAAEWMTRRAIPLFNLLLSTSNTCIATQHARGPGSNKGLQVNKSQLAALLQPVPITSF